MHSRPLAFLSATLFVPATVVAAPPDTAPVVREVECFDIGGGDTLCYELTGVFGSTNTSSGLVSTTQNFRIDTTVSGPQFV